MFKDKIRKQDIKAICLIGLFYVPAFVYRLFNRDVWLVSERKNEARDNGFWMYKYIRENHPKQKCFYVITKDSPDRKKINKYKTLINWGSLKHFFIFVVTKIRMSAHVYTDTPNFRVTNFLERHRVLRNKIVFLQHGIIKDKISFGYYSVNRAKLFVCGGFAEYEFCKKEFGHPEGTMKLTGLARYDGLINKSTNTQILIMPTWRSWLTNVNENDFVLDNYYLTYISLLKNKQLLMELTKRNIVVVFYLHPELQKYSHLFSLNDSNVLIADDRHYEVQELLNDSSLMITDYSSVAFDFAYLKKPIIYYHFDYDKYRKNQHQEGYFSYEINGMGPVVSHEKELVNEIINVVNNDFVTDDKYLKRISGFFKYYDNNNCLRIYNEIKKL